MISIGDFFGFDLFGEWKSHLKKYLWRVEKWMRKMLASSALKTLT